MSHVPQVEPPVTLSDCLPGACIEDCLPAWACIEDESYREALRQAFPLKDVGFTPLESMEQRLRPYPTLLEAFAFQEAKYYVWRPWGWPGVCRFFLSDEAASSPSDSLVRDFQHVY